MNQILPEEPHYKHYEYKQSNETSEKMNKFFKSPLGKWAVGILVTIGVVGGVFAINKLSNKNQPIETEVPTMPAEITPIMTQGVDTIEPDTTAESQSAESVEKIPTVEELEITDLTLIDKPEELVEKFLNLRTKWINSGSSENNDLAAHNTEDIQEYANSISKQYDDIYVKALLPDKWEGNQSLNEFVLDEVKIHENTLFHFFKTKHEDNMKKYFPEDKEPYWRKQNFKSVEKIVNTNGSIIIDATVYDSDNAQNNRVDGITGEYNHPSFTFSIVNEKIKLTHIIKR